MIDGKILGQKSDNIVIFDFGDIYFPVNNDGQYELSLSNLKEMVNKIAPVWTTDKKILMYFNYHLWEIYEVLPAPTLALYATSTRDDRRDDLKFEFYTPYWEDNSKMFQLFYPKYQEFNIKVSDWEQQENGSYQYSREPFSQDASTDLIYITHDSDNKKITITQEAQKIICTTTSLPSETITMKYVIVPSLHSREVKITY